jgi:ribulose-5-phosphate 4-epimerase/fuculose-1-phosphate aldolase
VTTDLNVTFARPAHIAPAEWAARVQLAAAYRIFDRLGWTELIYNHISLRVPDEPGHFLLNPFGLHYSEVCASNLVKVDVRGNIIGDSTWPINPAGFTFHGAIHETMPDAHCVMHVHTTPTMAVCCLDDGLSFSDFYAAQLYGKVAYHDFEGITVHLAEGRRILASANGHPVLLLRNHGPVMRAGIPDGAIAPRGIRTSSSRHHRAPRRAGAGWRHRCEARSGRRSPRPAASPCRSVAPTSSAGRSRKW